MFICSSSFFAHGMPSGLPMALWIHSLSSTGALQEHLQAEELAGERDFKTRMPTSWGDYENLLVGDRSILCGCKQAFQGPRRTSQHIPACQSLMAIFFSRTPKCYLRRSWARNHEDSKIDPMVQAHERQANRETSLVIGIGHISWSMVGLLALTRQKQLAKSRQAASQPASQC